MPGVLRDELEGIDFYIAQGYVEIARDTLGRLRAENGDHPEILARYDRLGISVPGADSIQPDSIEPIHSDPEPVESSEEYSGSVPGTSFPALTYETPAGQLDVLVQDEQGDNNDSTDDDTDQAKPFLIQKESGPLYPDLLVQLNTGDLQSPAAVEALRQLTGDLMPADERVGTGDLIASLVSNIGGSFDQIRQTGEEEKPILETGSGPLPVDLPIQREEAAPPHHTPLPSGLLDVLDSAALSPMVDQGRSAQDGLQEIFNDLKESTGSLKPLVDFETHYSLGLAYKDMDLMDEAIEEFQMAFKTAGAEDEGDSIHCCNMLGVCFKRKKMFKVAIMWFERGLQIRNRPEEEYQALRFEAGLCYEEMGDANKAIDAFTQVYGNDVNYRKVGEKIKQLQASLDA